MSEETMGPSRISRRRFLAVAGGVMATSMLMCGGGVAMVASPVPALDSGDNTYGKGDTGMKVLVAYASRYGSTAEVAEAIGARLGERGFAVDVRNIEDLASSPEILSGYSAVAVGSAVRVGNLLPAAVKFVEQNQGALRNIPVAYFAVHFLNT